MASSAERDNVLISASLPLSEYTYKRAINIFFRKYNDECIIGLRPPRCIVLEQSSQPRVKVEMKYSGAQSKDGEYSKQRRT
jgi:hypothetical protein